ncbi:MAG: heme-binding protein [Alcanivoracaceae bacterium]|nr:heme-binding protein [Alcanivoracaceae bacterium]
MNRVAGLCLSLLCLLLGSCGGDSPPSGGCDGSCVTGTSFLSVTDVENIIAAAALEADQRGVAATIAVSDRLGNVLAVYAMTGAVDAVTIASPYPVSGGLENISFIPASLAAISKAITGAYLSSEGNAFSSRTASQIVQEHFNPGERNQPGGPLFGVQFSQLSCSDLTVRRSAGQHGPKHAPLGLAADPGGFPLYRDGTVIGGIGVVVDDQYSFDANPADTDISLDEVVALAGGRGLLAPADRRAERITVDGKQLRYSDMSPSMVQSRAQPLPVFATLGGALLTVPGYFDAAGGIISGQVFGQAVSGIRPDTENFFPGRDAFVLVDGTNAPRFPPVAANDGIGALSQLEVATVLDQALAVANRARAQIRRPLGSQARVTISVVDRNGVPLGLVRTRDAPVFGIDVSLQKARTAAFYSGSQAAAELQSLPTADYLGPVLVAGMPTVERSIDIGDYVDALRAVLDNPTALADGAVAFTDRAGGNMSRPYFPDGLRDAPPGPLSKPAGEWSPFSTGLQLDLVYNQLIGHVAFAAGLAAGDVSTGCSTISRVTPGGNADPLANGMQVFPGSVPVYRGSTLVGAIGVSGDGVDQDDMISFLAIHQAGELLGTINNAPVAMRADQLTPQGVRLRYVQCPQAPFLDSAVQTPCGGK